MMSTNHYKDQGPTEFHVFMVRTKSKQLISRSNKSTCYDVIGPRGSWLFHSQKIWKQVAVVTELHRNEQIIKYINFILYFEILQLGSKNSEKTKKSLIQYF